MLDVPKTHPNAGQKPQYARRIRTARYSTSWDDFTRDAQLPLVKQSVPVWAWLTIVGTLGYFGIRKLLSRW